MVARWLNVILGVWMVLATWVLPATAQARTNGFWTGLAVIVFAVAATKVSPLRFINTGMGLWLVASPFILAYEAYGATINSVVVGLAVMALSVIPNMRRIDVPRRHRTVTP